MDMQTRFAHSLFFMDLASGAAWCWFYHTHETAIKIWSVSEHIRAELNPTIESPSMDGK